MSSSIQPGLSRRGVLVAALTGAVMPLAAHAQTLTAVPPADAAPDVASLAASDAASRLSIEVQINGKGPFRFIVDSGAERSVIADSVAAALALPTGKPVILNGITRQILAPTVSVDTLTFGPFERASLTLPVLSRSALSADGYLGLDAINGTRATFDFKAHSLRIEQPHRDPYSTRSGINATWVQTRGSNGHLQIMNCVVDGVKATAFVDTGAEVSVCNRPLQKALIDRSRQTAPYAQMTLSGVTGGEVIGDIVPVRRIRLQELSFTDGLLVAADLPAFEMWKLSQAPALLIGMNYLRQFASVSIDYRSKEIRFDLSQAPPHPLPGVEVNRLT